MASPGPSTSLWSPRVTSTSPSRTKMNSSPSWEEGRGRFSVLGSRETRNGFHVVVAHVVTQGLVSVAVMNTSL